MAQIAILGETAGRFGSWGDLDGCSACATTRPRWPSAVCECSRADAGGREWHRLERHRGCAGRGHHCGRTRRGARRGPVERTALRERGQPPPPLRRRHDRPGFSRRGRPRRASAQSPTGRDINGEICFAPTRRAASSPVRTPVSRPRRRAGASSRPTAPRSGKLTATYTAQRRRAVRLRVRARRHAVHERGRLPGLRHGQRSADHVVPALRRVPRSRPARTRTPTSGRRTSASSRPTSAPPGAVAVDAAGSRLRRAVVGAEHRAVLAAVPDRPRLRPAAAAASTRPARRSPTPCSARPSPRPPTGCSPSPGSRSRPNGNLYASSVLTGRIAEYDLDGNLVRLLLAPPRRDAADPHRQPPRARRRCRRHRLLRRPRPRRHAAGRRSRSRTARCGASASTPTAIRCRPMSCAPGSPSPTASPSFPGDLESTNAAPLEWPTLAGGAERQFFNPAKPAAHRGNRTDDLVERWRFRTGAVVARRRRSIATVDAPDGGRIEPVFVTSWDGTSMRSTGTTGAELWRFAWEDQPGASFPAAGSRDDRRRRRSTASVFVGAGEHVYALDAATRRRAVALRRRHRVPATRPLATPGPLRVRAVSATRSSRPRSSSAARVLRDGRQRRPHRQGRLLRGRRQRRHPRSGSSTSRAVSVCRPDRSDEIRKLRRLPQRGASSACPPASSTTRSRLRSRPRPRRAAATCGRRPPTTRSVACCTSARATATPTTTRRRRCPPPPMPPLRRGARRPPHRRHAGVALAAARGRQRRPRLRCRAEPLHDRRRRTAHRGRRHRRQGRHLLRPRPRRREREHRRGVGRRRPVRHAVLVDQRRARAAPSAAIIATASVDESGPSGVLLDRARATTSLTPQRRPSTRSTSTPARWSGRTPRPPASPPATPATGPRAACPAS